MSSGSATLCPASARPYLRTPPRAAPPAPPSRGCPPAWALCSVSGVGRAAVSRTQVGLSGRRVNILPSEKVHLPQGVQTSNHPLFSCAQQYRGMTGTGGSTAAGLCSRCHERDPLRRSTAPAAPQLRRGVQVGAVPHKLDAVYAADLCPVTHSACFLVKPWMLCPSGEIYS